MKIFTSLHEERGVTVVMVTHDPAVAVYGKRLIGLRDGAAVLNRPIKESDELIDMGEILKSGSIRVG